MEMSENPNQFELIGNCNVALRRAHVILSDQRERHLPQTAGAGRISIDFQEWLLKMRFSPVRAPHLSWPLRAVPGGASVVATLLRMTYTGYSTWTP